MTNVLSPSPVQKFFDNNGAPLASGLLFTYQAGTTTKLTSYKDSTGTTNTNPLVLNARGECDLWIPPNVSYKYVLAPSTDTDPPTNPIKTIDNVVYSQLTTLYGGVDTGVADAYILTFTSNFNSYGDGTVIYWIPSHTNTGASTLNVNGLGVISIVNQDGSVLGAGQLGANQVVEVLYKGGQFLLIFGGSTSSIISSSFAPAWSGFSVSPSGTMYYQITGKLVTLEWVGGQGTSNATSMAITNLPFGLRPASGKDANGQTTTVVIDNAAYAVGTFGLSGLSSIQFNKGTAPPSGSGFTNPGTKGLPNGWTGSYMLL